MQMPQALNEKANETKTILCFGVDPDINKIQNGNNADIQITEYFNPIIETLLEGNAISALKPNYAYFAQYGFHGLYALSEIMQRYRNKVPIILDVKRGDIGKSSEAYAREAYDVFGADAVTVSPYMGFDSVAPFLREGKTVYVLCKTSNKGSDDFQMLKVGKKKLYEAVAEKAMTWKCGLVVGATSDSIKKITKITKNRIPLLIPGIGSQGGDLEMVLKAIKGNLPIHRINASSSIAYAYEKTGGKPADAALKEAEKLNSVIRKYF